MTNIRYRPISPIFADIGIGPYLSVFLADTDILFENPRSSHTVSATLILLLSLVEKQLAKLVRHDLTPTCASIEVERLFPTNSDVFTPERNLLLPENAGQILYLHENVIFEV